MPSARRRAVLLALPLTVAALGLTACGGGSNATTSGASSSASGAASGAASAPAASPTGVAAATGPVKQTKVGVTVTGNLGDKPALTVPGQAAPTALSSEVLVQGTGAVVAKGQTLVVNYLGQTWTPKDGQPNIFDNSYDRGEPASFAIGVGQVIQGWDKTLVGAKIGSRVLLAIPPADAYGTASAGAGNELSGQTLLFVVDVLGTLDKNAAATGTVVTNIPAGFPKVTNPSGKEPAVTSVEGVTAPTTDPVAALLITGTGVAIDPKKSLALQIIETDTATGKNTTKTWGTAAQLTSAGNVLGIAKVLEGQKVGSRVLVVTPKTSDRESSILVLDVVGQF